MSYKEINLRALTPESAVTEIMYEIAACRADNIDLIRINILENAEDYSDFKKIISSLIKLFKKMKQKGSIQLFATAESFNKSTTEAVYLQNKYPQLLSSPTQPQTGAYIYIKI